MKLSKITVMTTVAAAVLSFGFLQSAEAGFGIKMPNIPGVIKSSGSNSGSSTNGAVVSKSVDVNNTIWPSFSYQVKNLGAPVAGAKIYKVTLSNSARYVAGHNESGVWVYDNIKTSELVGTTDANGCFNVKNFPGGEVMRLVLVKEGWHAWTYTEDRMRYKAPAVVDLNRRNPGLTQVRGLVK